MNKNVKIFQCMVNRYNMDVWCKAIQYNVQGVKKFVHEVFKTWSTTDSNSHRQNCLALKHPLLEVAVEVLQSLQPTPGKTHYGHGFST